MRAYNISIIYCDCFGGKMAAFTASATNAPTIYPPYGWHHIPTRYPSCSNIPPQNTQWLQIRSSFW